MKPDQPQHLSFLPSRPFWSENAQVSAVEGQLSVVDNEPLKGRPLDQLIRLLLKIIDASDDLSVQVHPNHEQARQLGSGAQSKNEAWLILHTDPGAKLVQGVAEGIDRARFEELVAQEKIEECLRFVEVDAGAVVPVQSGTLHAIGKGVVLLELQESSDTTYRFDDDGRLGLDGKPRALHIEQALAAVHLGTNQ